MKNLLFHVALWVVSLLLVPLTGWGQGWERAYNFGKNEIGRRGIETQNNEFVLATTQNESIAKDKAVHLSRIDGQGELLWTKAYSVPGIFDIVYLHERADGSLILLSVENDSALTKKQNVFWIFSGSGDLLDKKVLDLPGVTEFRVYKVNFLQDALMMAGYWKNNIDSPFLSKVSLNGDLVWSRKFNAFKPERFVDVEHDQDNNLWVVHTYYTVDSWYEWKLLKMDQQGNTLLSVPLIGGSTVPLYKIKSSGDAILVMGASKVYPLIHSSLKKMDLQGNTLATAQFELPFSAEAPVLCTTSDGGAALAVYAYTNFPQKNYTEISLIRFDQDLNWLWNKNYYRGNYNYAYDLHQTASGGFLMTGTTDSQSNLYVIRTDSLGNSITNFIQGRVQWDLDNDCTEQASDPGLNNWIVTVASATDTFYRSTEANGAYSIQVDTGHYIVQVHPLNSLWSTDCVVLDTVLTQTFDTINQNFPVQAAVDCPGMEVSTTVIALRPCFSANLQVWYCNKGTITGEDAQIQVVLNEHMTYDSASFAPSLVSGDTLWFSLGDVAPFDCGNFFVRVLVDCDTNLIGQTLCYNAHIFPDSSCLPPTEWSGAHVVVTGTCEGDSVLLILKNIGTAPTTSGLEYIIVEDNVILIQMPFDLDPDEFIELKLPANGATWRLIAEQEPGFDGGAFTTVALEGCYTGNGFSTGFINQFPGNDAPWLQEDCHLVTGSYDPNDKSAVPEGYGEQHFVAANTDLEYLIRFQNTGTDTAFRVVIRDQISPLLDPASVQPGAASHPYTWSLTGTGELAFTFDPIALPDSNTNGIGSQGFVQFRIAQRPNLPQNTRFENQAAIYFDFNAPVLTNTVFHTVQPLFKPTSGVKTPVFAAGERMKIWPNPASDVAYISFKDNALSPRKLSLHDLNGRLVAVTYSAENTLAVQRGKLPAGMYLVKVETDGRMQVGTVVFR